MPDLLVDLAVMADLLVDPVDTVELEATLVDSLAGLLEDRLDADRGCGTGGE